jgi:putative phosphoesterase
MKIAIISDIHGNYFALEEVLADIEKQGIDQIICLGDVFAFGPEPSKCVDRLKTLNCPVIVGNTDDWVLQPPSISGTEGRMRVNAERLHWCHEKLNSDQISFVKSFEPTLEVNLEGESTLLCFHGSPNSFNDIILSTTSEDELKDLFHNSRGSIMAGGHTHIQMYRRWNESILINPGSVGLPLRQLPIDEHTKLLHHAEYAIVTSTKSNHSIQFRHVSLNIENMLEEYAQSDLPYFDEWIGWWTQS